MGMCVCDCVYMICRYVIGACYIVFVWKTVPEQPGCFILLEVCKGRLSEYLRILKETYIYDQQPTN